ncbi:hypothetical protein J8273_8310 [Carpediemonas membranifera]|uniref:Uncharacterized protein n=1 Tax=Carpediemonas membranifera TaxID=201153 RepID=A0A8J6ASC7_9EUKA|nr:hypothetical protein J8273_8310 [Carpediemonas membranifera]|eukprot:KAG9390270.1 hypothetical protein J8273_8310 [Carpediemonas membranifera]
MAVNNGRSPSSSSKPAVKDRGRANVPLHASTLREEVETRQMTRGKARSPEVRGLREPPKRSKLSRAVNRLLQARHLTGIRDQMLFRLEQRETSQIKRNYLQVQTKYLESEALAIINNGESIISALKELETSFQSMIDDVRNDRVVVPPKKEARRIDYSELPTVTDLAERLDASDVAILTSAGIIDGDGIIRQAVPASASRVEDLTKLNLCLQAILEQERYGSEQLSAHYLREEIRKEERLAVKLANDIQAMKNVLLDTPTSPRRGSSRPCTSVLQDIRPVDSHGLQLEALVEVTEDSAPVPPLDLLPPMSTLPTMPLIPTPLITARSMIESPRMVRANTVAATRPRRGSGPKTSTLKRRTPWAGVGSPTIPPSRGRDTPDLSLFGSPVGSPIDDRPRTGFIH